MICMGTFSNKVELDCTHAYCFTCIVTWASSNNMNSHKCPVCRAVIGYVINPELDEIVIIEEPVRVTRSHTRADTPIARRDEPPPPRNTDPSPRIQRRPTRVHALPSTHSWCLVPLIAHALGRHHPDAGVLMTLPSFALAADELRQSNVLVQLRPQRMNPLYFSATDQDRLINDVFMNVDVLTSRLALYFQACIDHHRSLLASMVQRPARHSNGPSTRRQREVTAGTLEPHEARNVVWTFATQRLGSIPPEQALGFVRRMLAACEDLTMEELHSLLEENLEQL